MNGDVWIGHGCTKGLEAFARGYSFSVGSIFILWYFRSYHELLFIFHVQMQVRMLLIMLLEQALKC